MNNLEAVLFDLDGTLIDSEYYYYCCWSPVLKRNFDLDFSYQDWLQNFAGHTDEKNFSILRERYHAPVEVSVLRKEIEASYADRPMTSIPLMPYAKEILALLKDKHIKIGLVTSSRRHVADLILGHHDLLSYFDFFMTKDLVENTKPHPEPYLMAIDNLHLPKESIVAIEDTAIGYASATAAGLECYIITTQDFQLQMLPDAAKKLPSLADFAKELV